MADIGWITGHSYVVYGPLSNGATTVLFESTPTYPDPGRYWEMVERLRVNQFYGAPTALRLLLKSSNSYVEKTQPELVTKTCNDILNLLVCGKPYSRTVQMEQFFPVVLFIVLQKVVLTFESVHEIPWCDHSNGCTTCS